MAEKNALTMLQQKAEQQKEDIYTKYLESLLRFQSLSPDLSKDDIQNVRIFVGACLIEHLSLMHQAGSEKDMEEKIKKIIN